MLNEGEAEGEVSRGRRYCLGAGMNVSGVQALNLSRRGKNRADLSSYK